MTDVSVSAERADERRQSMKVEIIEELFLALWPEGVPRPNRRMYVTQEEIRRAIVARNARHADGRPLSPGNAPNFLKDFLRKRTCNANWPRACKVRRITARQVYGSGRVMEFVDYGDNDAEPFPDRFDPISGMRVIPFEALSIPVEARALGRMDEPWLVQVIVNQRVLNTHFAVVASAEGLIVETLAHLQNSVKTQPEIDATFIASLREGDQKIRAYVTCEAKQYNERILEDQIRAQVKKAFEFTSKLSGEERIDAVIPTVFQIIDYANFANQPSEVVRGIYVAQFAPIRRNQFASLNEPSWEEMRLMVQSRAFYQPFPAIQGISKFSRHRRSSRKVE